MRGTHCDHVLCRGAEMSAWVVLVIGIAVVPHVVGGVLILAGITYALYLMYRGIM